MALRVAIFEDNKLVRESFEAILNGTDGFTCSGSFSGCNNLKHDIERSRPDIVLMDIEMPGMSGIEATKKIKQDHPDIKILIQTVFDDDEKVFAAICAGASGYILKKTTPAKLIEAIQEVNDGGAPMSPGIATKVLTLFQKFAPAQQKTNDEQANLTKREKEILLLMMEGDNYHTIAAKYFLSYDTVRTHVRSIYKKLHVASVNQAIVKAFKQRLM
jgi:DNA-binding NarL/FixJ family response regulator